MKNVKLADITLYASNQALSFKDRIEIVRHLDNLRTDVIYMPRIENQVADTLLIRTVASFVNNSTLCSVCQSEEEIKIAFEALKCAKSKRICISLPISDVQMEYFLNKKTPKVLEMVKELVALAKSLNSDVEFMAKDATRADKKFLKDVITTAIEQGATTITICDDEGVMLLDEFKNFFDSLYAEIPALRKLNVGLVCNNTYKMAVSSALACVLGGVNEVKCAVANKEYLDLEELLAVLKNCTNKFGICSNVNFEEFHRINKQISWILGEEKSYSESPKLSFLGKEAEFSVNDSKAVVMDAVKRLGYDVSAEDSERVFEEFKKVAEKKTVTSKDLDAIVGNVASQVPPIYKLVSFVINNGNIIQSSAQITVNKNGETLSAVAIGDGPVDASFRALEQIVGHKFELDDFQIQAVTEGKEAIGSAIVRLRSNGKLYSANGISTDIIGASIGAYINAVNKIVYEEEN